MPTGHRKEAFSLYECDWKVSAKIYRKSSALVQVIVVINVLFLAAQRQDKVFVLRSHGTLRHLPGPGDSWPAGPLQLDLHSHHQLWRCLQWDRGEDRPSDGDRARYLCSNTAHDIPGTTWHRFWRGRPPVGRQRQSSGGGHVRGGNSSEQIGHSTHRIAIITSATVLIYFQTRCSSTSFPPFNRVSASIIYFFFSLFHFSGSAHRVFNLHALRSCAFSIFTPSSFSQKIGKFLRKNIPSTRLGLRCRLSNRASSLRMEYSNPIV